LITHTALMLFYSSTCSFSSTTTAPSDIYTLSLHDALPILRKVSRLYAFSVYPDRTSLPSGAPGGTTGSQEVRPPRSSRTKGRPRSEEHTSELQSPDHLVCRLLLEKKKRKQQNSNTRLTTL